MLITLDKSLYDKIKKYKESFQFGKKNDSKSEYWLSQINNIKIHFKDPNKILLIGQSGVYLSKNNNFMNLMKNFIINVYNIIFNYKNSYFNYVRTFNNLSFSNKNFFQKIQYKKRSENFDDVAQIKNNFFNNKILNEKIIHSYYFLKVLLTKIDFKTNQNICEIGPGNGNLISIIKKNFTNCNFIMIDLEETLLVSSTYLSSLFPDKKFLLPNEIKDKIDLKLIKENDFILITPEQINLIQPEIIDLTINTSSFGEMNQKQIKKYFDLIQIISKKNGYFFNYNRVEKFAINSKETDILTKPNRFHEYPFYNNDVEYFQICEFAKKVQNDPIFLRLEKIIK